ncbi:hypothetical protein DB41_CH00010, partial [Neochlamydia sp. TUME1]
NGLIFHPMQVWQHCQISSPEGVQEMIMKDMQATPITVCQIDLSHYFILDF